MKIYIHISGAEERYLSRTTPKFWQNMRVARKIRNSFISSPPEEENMTNN
jgi:hypothetical protein